MSFVYGLIAVGVLILLLFAAPAVMRVLPRGGPVIAGNWRTVGTVLGGLIAGIVFITLSVKSTMGWEFWVIFAGLMVAAIILRGTAPGRLAAGFVVIFFIGYGIFHAIYGKEASKVAEVNQQEITKATLTSPAPSGQTPTATQSGKAVGPIVTDGQAKWSVAGVEDTIPVDVWSEVTSIGVGCSVKFATGDGYEVQYRYYETKWHDYPPGTSPDMNELRYKVTKEGKKAPPYRITCQR